MANKENSNMKQTWKYGLETPPKSADFPVIGKLPIDNQRHPERCHYFVMYGREDLHFRVGKADYLWKSIENI